jgi:hypothetical protein
MSITNKLVANIKQTQVDINKFTDTNNVICIDTCNNRIGINTKTPRYSIDICGTNGKIFVSNLDTSFINFNTISGTTINCLDGSFARNLDTSFINFKTISGSLIRATTISGINIVGINIVGICGNIIDLSGTNIKLSNELIATTISANNINASIIIAQDITARTYNINRSVFNTMSSLTGDFSNISVKRTTKTTISGGTIDCSNLNANFILSNTIDCITLSAGTVRTDDLRSASGDKFFTISGDGLFYLNTGLGALGRATIISQIDEKLKDDVSTNVLTARQGYIFDCCINNLKVTNIDISGRLTLPQQTSGTAYTISYGSLAIKTFRSSSINSLTLYNSNLKWSNIFTATQYATLDLSSSITNNIKNNNIRERELDILPNYRYIPIKFKMINASPSKTELFNISTNNNYIEITNSDLSSGIYEINASVTLSYNNTISGDVEPNDFTFGLYDKAIVDTNIASSTINTNVTVETSFNYVKNKNLILAFDNSYNYSSVSLNYIGPLYNYIHLNSSNYKRGVCYLVNSQKDISNFNVEYFSSTIKLLNYDT